MEKGNVKATKGDEGLQKEVREKKKGERLEKGKDREKEKVMGYRGKRAGPESKRKELEQGWRYREKGRIRKRGGFMYL